MNLFAKVFLHLYKYHGIAPFAAHVEYVRNDTFFQYIHRRLVKSTAQNSKSVYAESTDAWEALLRSTTTLSGCKESRLKFPTYAPRDQLECLKFHFCKLERECPTVGPWMNSCDQWLSPNSAGPTKQERAELVNLVTLMKGCPCNAAVYCGAACQAKDRSDHKETCKRLIAQQKERANVSTGDSQMKREKKSSSPYDRLPGR